MQRKLDDLAPERQAMIRALAEERGCTILPMSTVSEEGINDVKTVACNLLLEHRVERKTAKLDTRRQGPLARWLQ